MAEVELIMPKMGESITEATILKWLKNEGDKVELDEAVLEIATDKVDSEVPSPFAGTLSKILYKVGDVIAVNKPIAIISTDAAAAKSAAPVSAPTVTPQIFLHQPRPMRFLKPRQSLLLQQMSLQLMDTAMVRVFILRSF